jgi:hypothetical protein
MKRVGERPTKGGKNSQPPLVPGTVQGATKTRNMVFGRGDFLAPALL